MGAVLRKNVSKHEEKSNVYTEGRNTEADGEVFEGR
jgi:hypothetical protein